MKIKFLLLASLALAIPAAHGETTLYSQSFSSTSTANLNGTAVEGGTLSANWTANGTSFRLNGTSTTVVGSAVLPFTPVAGMIYTVSATVSGTNANWGGIGFANTTATWDTATGDKRFLGPNLRGQPWMINHPSNIQQAWIGPGTDNEVTGSNQVNAATVNLSVVLNTENPVWTASFFVDGTQFGATTDYGTNPTINSVGLSSSGTTGTRTFSNFSLTAVPAPSGGTFANWIDGFGLDPADQGFGDDPDGDGIANGVEAWFGTNPAIGNAGLTLVAKSGNVFSFQHPQADPALTDVTGSYQWSLDLVTWHPDTTTTVGDTTVTITSSTVSGTTTVEADTTGSVTSPATLFVRAVATQN